MNAFREKMATEQAQAVYRRRGPIAEFVHAWIKARQIADTFSRSPTHLHRQARGVTSE